MQRQLYHLQQHFPLSRILTLYKEWLLVASKYWAFFSDSGMMLATFERKVVYLSDNATQMQTKMMENMVEIKKIQKIRIY